MNQPTSPLLPLVMRRYRVSIAATYFLFLGESFSRLAVPWCLSAAIDGLFRFESTPLLLLFGVQLLHSTIASFRQVVDTRVYGTIAARLATDLVLQQRRAGVPASHLAARSTMTRAIVEFFERCLPAMTRSLVLCLGGGLMIWRYDPLAAVWTGLIALPVAALSIAIHLRTGKLSTALHDQLEQEVEAIESRTPEQLSRHFELISSWQNRISDAEALQFGLLELAALLLTGACLWRCAQARTSLGDTPPGCATSCGVSKGIS